MTEFYPDYVPKNKGRSENRSFLSAMKRGYLRLELATSFYMLEPMEKIVAYMILFFLLAILLHHSVTIWHFIKYFARGLFSVSLSCIEKIKAG